MADESLDVNDYNGGPLVGTCIAFLALSWLAVGLRTYTRAVVIKGMQEDDWLMLVAQVTSSEPSGLFERAMPRLTIRLCVGDFHALVCFCFRRCSRWHGTA